MAFKTHAYNSGCLWCCALHLSQKVHQIKKMKGAIVYYLNKQLSDELWTWLECTKTSTIEGLNPIYPHKETLYIICLLVWGNLINWNIIRLFITKAYQMASCVSYDEPCFSCLVQSQHPKLLSVSLNCLTAKMSQVVTEYKSTGHWEEQLLTGPEANCCLEAPDAG